MITAVDSNVLFDLFLTNSPYHPQALRWLKDAHEAGSLILCDIVYAELVPAFDDRLVLDGALREIGVSLVLCRFFHSLRSGSALEAVSSGWRAANSDHYRLPNWRSCVDYL